jgi:hypothetical protein
MDRPGAASRRETMGNTRAGGAGHRRPTDRHERTMATHTDRARRTGKLHHRVYCVELHTSVRGNRRFQRQNCYTTPAMTCLYVGSTGLDPAARFANHLRGHKGCPLVREYGLRLREDLYGDFPAMTWKDALATEIAWAKELRELGYAVYQH